MKKNIFSFLHTSPLCNLSLSPLLSFLRYRVSWRPGWIIIYINDALFLYLKYSLTWNIFNSNLDLYHQYLRTLIFLCSRNSSHKQSTLTFFIIIIILFFLPWPQITCNQPTLMCPHLKFPRSLWFGIFRFQIFRLRKFVIMYELWLLARVFE